MKAVFILFSICASLAVTSAATDKVFCYFASWTVYRDRHGTFDVSNIDPKLCTHILYAFVGINDDGSLHVLDDWEIDGLHGIENLIALKKDNPGLKVLVSMGGWGEGSLKYSTVAADPAKRAKMVETVLAFIDKHKFDGFDLDWEYPAQRDGRPEDKKNYVTLLSELKAALHAKNLLLTAAVAGAGPSIDISYDVPNVAANLDYINIMAYDYHGSFDGYVGHVAPLYPSSLDKTEAQRQINVAAGVEHWIKRGADPKQLILGTAFYGRTFTLANPANTSLYADIWGPGLGGPITYTPGMIGYNEICEFKSDMLRVWDDEQKVPHKVQGNQWFGYDDVESLTLKAEFAISKKLGGVMAWSLDTDDFNNYCKGGKYPLLTALNKALGRV